MKDKRFSRINFPCVRAVSNDISHPLSQLLIHGLTNKTISRLFKWVRIEQQAIFAIQKLSTVHVLKRTSNFVISRRSCAGTAKKLTEKRDAHARIEPVLLAVTVAVEVSRGP